ncbi:MAG: CHAT domain-containing protein [Cytophagaceae bacterium]|nr:CHAT domain-containing protein [Gemmatimonadaceae bacterium]
MHVEHAQLTSALREVGFSSKTAVSGQFDAALTRWEPRASDPDASREVVVARECAHAVGVLGLRVTEVHRIQLADSAASFLTFTVIVLPQSYEVVGLIAVYDAMEPRLIPRATATDAGPAVVFTVEADRSTSRARGAWVAILGAPKGSPRPEITDAMSRELVMIASSTLGRVQSPGSIPREESRPTRSKPPMRGIEAPPAPSPPPMQAPAAPLPPPPPPASSAPLSPPGAGKRLGLEPKGPTRRARSRGAPTRSGSAGHDLAELNVTRRPEIAFHELVIAGETHPLVLKLSDAITREQVDQAFSIAIAAGKESITLSVSLSAPGFAVAPSREQPITIGRTFDGKKEQVTFMLTAQEPASGEPVRRDIRADIWSGNASIGGVTHWTTVRPKAWKGPVKPAGESRIVPFDTSAPGRECELVIRVEGKDDHGSPPFQVSLRSRIPGEPEVESLRVGTITFTRTELASFLTDQFESFAERFPADGNAASLKAWRADLLEEVDTLGKWLWTQLPDAFRDEYFRLYDAKHLPGSILVHSDEMLIPWELIVPHGRGKVLPRLGVAHVMGRWRPALGMRPRPQALTVTSATIANPQYQDAGFLIWSLLEAADLTQALPVFTKMPTVDKASMKKLLDRTDIQLLHFTGHGKYAKHADLSTLILENGDTITAMHFIGSKLLEVGHPIVYLNACEVGTSGVTMGQMGGFAAQCVEGGCSGIVAPYWAVADDSAREFAVAFYGQLKAGKAIGEALQALRKAKPKDPTYQAFAYLGDPWAQARFA